MAEPVRRQGHMGLAGWVTSKEGICLQEPGREW